MLCSISGQVPQTPVLSTKSGYVFEKRLIEHEIEEHGVCPITKEPLSLDDLIEVKLNKAAKPRSSSTTSIPGLLNLFHNEWDALMLECHSLRQSLTTARQELSQSLYQHDAACRVIARLMRERDSARETLAKLQGQSKEDLMEEGRPAKRMLMGITKEISEFIRQTSEESARRRQDYEMSEEVVKPEELQEYSLLASQPLHATKQGGILSLAYHPSLKNVLASGGEDSTIKIFDQSSGTILASIEEHFKRVNDVEWIPEAFLVSCSSDKSVRVWVKETENFEMKCGLNLRHHEDEVVSITCAQNARFLISASKDATLAFIDLEQGKSIEKLTSSLVDCGYSIAKFHPDGMICGSGTDAGEVHLWDLSNQKIIKSLSDDHDSSITGLAFHENGFHMATASQEIVRIWDIRKMETLKEIVFSPHSCVGFDHDGRYFGVGSKEGVHLLDCLQDYKELISFRDVPGVVRSIEFGDYSTRVVIGSTDHNLRLFGHD